MICPASYRWMACGRRGVASAAGRKPGRCRPRARAAGTVATDNGSTQPRARHALILCGHPGDAEHAKSFAETVAQTRRGARQERRDPSRTPAHRLRSGEAQGPAQRGRAGDAGGGGGRGRGGQESAAPRGRAVGHLPGPRPPRRAARVVEPAGAGPERRGVRETLRRRQLPGAGLRADLLAQRLLRGARWPSATASSSPPRRPTRRPTRRRSRQFSRRS